MQGKIDFNFAYDIIRYDKNACYYICQLFYSMSAGTTVAGALVNLWVLMVKDWKDAKCII